jgi:L-rhamnose isomerase
LNVLVDAKRPGVEGYAPVDMTDQLHNATDPIENLM